MTEVLFAHSYHLALDPKQVRAGAPYPPLGTLYAAAVARARGLSVAVHDAMFQPGPETFAGALARHQPRMVVLYEDSFHWLSKMCLDRMRQAALAMVATARARGVVVAVNGSDCADHPEDYLRAGADFVIFGEGEWTLDELCAHVFGAGSVPLAQIPPVAERAIRSAALCCSSLTCPPACAVVAPSAACAGLLPGPGSGRVVPREQILGLGFRGADGALVKNPKRPLAQDLDALPWPARDLCDLAPYRRAWRRHGRFSLNLVTTRGCPFLCNWCAKPIYGNTYHSRSPGAVVEEMERLGRDFGAGHLWFADDIMGLKARWLTPFADEVQRRGLRLPFKCQTRVDLMNEEHVDALARAGCEEVWLGAESGSQKILDAMEKGTTVEQIHAAARRLKARGIKTCFFLQFGYPGETLEDVEATRRLVRACRPDDIGISVSYPLPGTRFYTAVRERLGAKRHWDHSGDLDPLFPGHYSKAFYRRLYAAVHAEFRARLGARKRSPLALAWAARWLLAEGRLRLRLRTERARPAPARKALRVV